MKPSHDDVVTESKTSTPCKAEARPWSLAATILGSSLAFIDSTVVNVALPALESSLHANIVDVQWVVESYGLFLGALILVGGSFGDVFGRRGRLALARWLPGYRDEHGIDFVIANAENSASGKGVSRSTFKDLIDAGVDLLNPVLGVAPALLSGLGPKD